MPELQAGVVVSGIGESEWGSEGGVAKVGAWRGGGGVSTVGR
jgi:hypothetical protein